MMPATTEELLLEVLVELLHELRVRRREREREEEARRRDDGLTRRYGYPPQRRRWRDG